MAKLQAAVALLPDRELANRLAAAALAGHAATQGRLRWPRLPAHLSLKQPFSVESLPALEHAIERLAAESAPIRATLGALEVQPPSAGSPEAVIWVGVDAEASLLELQRQIDALLEPSAAEALAPFVSDAYRFHVTLGFLPTVSLAAPLPQLTGLTATFAELALFVYDGLPRAGWQCMLYSRRSLSGAVRAVHDLTAIAPSR